MFDYIRGKIVDKDANSIVIEAGGIGYFVYMPSTSVSQLKNGMEAKIYIYMHITEDNISLYGFIDKNERRLFKSFISVTGIGPKVALNMLSSYSPSQLLTFIVTDDVKSITNVPGIGKKTAQRLIVELKDKVSNDDIAINCSGSNDTNVNEVVQALLALGFSNSEISNVIKDVEGLDVSEAIKLSLRELGE